MLLTLDNFKELERPAFERKLGAMYSRKRTLPPDIVQVGPFTDLWVEAQRLYVEGHFYSCVAMCGITGERILKDLFLDRILILRDDRGHVPSATEARVLERLQADAMRRLLEAAGFLSPSVSKRSKELMDLRNQYAHGGGKDSEKDAGKAIKLLHDVMQGTVSVLQQMLEAQIARAKKAKEALQASEAGKPAQDVPPAVGGDRVEEASLGGSPTGDTGGAPPGEATTERT